MRGLFAVNEQSMKITCCFGTAIWIAFWLCYWVPNRTTRTFFSPFLCIIESEEDKSTPHQTSTWSKWHSEFRHRFDISNRRLLGYNSENPINAFLSVVRCEEQKNKMSIAGPQTHCSAMNRHVWALVVKLQLKWTQKRK